MKFDFTDAKLLDDSGMPIMADGKPMLLKDIIRQNLLFCKNPQRPAIKCLDLAIKFRDNDIVELDTTDRELVLAVCAETEVARLTEARIEQALDEKKALP